jgi:hypothetical protein
MATFLDVTLLSNVSVIFGFLLVWTLVYGVLSFSKAFELQQHIRALVALLAAFLTLFIPAILEVIMIIVPWFTLMLIFIVFVVVALMALGVSKDNIAKAMRSSSGNGVAARNAIVIIGFVIVGAALGQAFFSGEEGVADPGAAEEITDGNAVTGDVGSTGQSALLATLFHPRMLGAIFVLLISMFAVLQLAK